MDPLACTAIGEAGLAAVTASADREDPTALLLVAGWLSTAVSMAPTDARSTGRQAVSLNGAWARARLWLRTSAALARRG